MVGLKIDGMDIYNIMSSLKIFLGEKGGTLPPELGLNNELALNSHLKPCHFVFFKSPDLPCLIYFLVSETSLLLIIKHLLLTMYYNTQNRPSSVSSSVKMAPLYSQ